VTGYLLDTSVALMALTQPNPPLSKDIRSAIVAGPNVLSVIVYWEIMLKSMKGTLDVGDPRIWWAEALDQLVARPLPLSPEHIASVYHLSPLHGDPFDRVLVGQAIAEELTLLTTDRAIPRYASERLRVIH